MKILITIIGDNVAPRFDLTTEVLIATIDGRHSPGKPRTILMNRPSAEELCNLIIKEDISILICGGIEENNYKYLVWKKIQVIDSIIGPYREALDLAIENKLEGGAILPGARRREAKA